MAEVVKLISGVKIMKCINCGKENKGDHRAYCPPCIVSGTIPVRSGFAWHALMKKTIRKKDMQIMDLELAVKSLKKI